MDLLIKAFALFGFLVLVCIIGANCFNDDHIIEMEE
jgi:hypothetical protein